MKLLFLILAHDRPEAAVELAAALAEGASDARALIHFDARAGAGLFDRLAAAAAAHDRVRLVEPRVATPWGQWGLVEAPLNALQQARGWSEAPAPGEAPWTPDRVLLLSGACLPCRPMPTLERFFGQHPHREFIEAEPISWIKGGIREDRYRHWFPFNFQTQYRRHYVFHHAQSILGIDRGVPDGLRPRFGSQWWALTWETCLKLLEHRDAHPEHMRWFRWSWIPDEFAIQTLVHAHVPARRIAGRNLTHFLFTDDGKPVVYYDDHREYPRSLDAFFLRKVSPEAARLREDCLALARAEDDGAPVVRDGRAAADHGLRARALGDYGRPGQPFQESQGVGAGDVLLARGRRRYIVLVGPPALTRIAMGFMPEGVVRLGEIFAAGRVDFGEGRDGLVGLAPEDAAIRDVHPLLYLMRVLDRVEGIAALTWSPFHAPLQLADVLGDPNAVVAPILPMTGDPGRDLALLAQACGEAGGAPARALSDVLGGPPERRARALVDDSGAREPLRRLLPYALAGETQPADALLTDPVYRLVRRRTPTGVGFMTPPPARPIAAVAPLWWRPDGAEAETRRAALEAGLAELAAIAMPGGGALSQALRQAWTAIDAEAGALDAAADAAPSATGAGG